MQKLRRRVCVAGRAIRSGCEGAFGIRSGEGLRTTRLALVLVLLLSPGMSAFEMEAYVKAPNAEAGDHFGSHGFSGIERETLGVALSGDTLAVGTSNEDSC